MDTSEIESEVRRLAPWHHDIELPHGVHTHVPDLSKRDVERTRTPNLIRHMWDKAEQACGGSLQGLRVLDVACNCGGFSVHAAQRGADYVLGFDIASRYIEQARFVQSQLDLPALDFQQLSIDDLDPEVHGTFDLTLCFGILYHLENPVGALKRLSAVTGSVMVVDTNLDPNTFGKAPLWRMNVARAASTKHKASSTALWRTEDSAQFRPNDRAVVELLKFVGFPDVERLEPVEADLESRYYDGRRATYVARR